MPRARRAARRPSARETLSRERIEAALVEAAARGAFTMPLGVQLGVDPMAAYRHFRDNEALVDAMVDAALAEFHPPGPNVRDPFGGAAANGA